MTPSILPITSVPIGIRVPKSFLCAFKMSQSIKQAIFKPQEFAGRTRALFRAMKTGDYFGLEKIPHFNGWLFDDDEVLTLTADELQYLAEAAKLDWSGRRDRRRWRLPVWRRLRKRPARNRPYGGRRRQANVTCA